MEVKHPEAGSTGVNDGYGGPGHSGTTGSLRNKVRQCVFQGIGGLKEIDGNSIGSLKLDGSQYNLHIKNHKAYALTSKRVSVKTNLLNDRIENFPELKKIKFPFKKETIIVCEVVAEHLGKKGAEKLGYAWAKRSNLVASIMNAKPETIKEKYSEGNPLKLVAFSVLWWEGNDVSNFTFWEKQLLLKDVFFSAGVFGEKLSGSGLLYRIENFKAKELKIDCLNTAENYVRSKDFIYEGFVFFDLKTGKSAKVKRMLNLDAIVLGADFNSTGKYKQNGWIKSISVGVLKKPIKDLAKKNRLSKKETEILLSKGELVHVGWVSGMDEYIRKTISENWEGWIGSVVEIDAMDFTGVALRHPRYIQERNDKDINRCTMGQLE